MSASDAVDRSRCPGCGERFRGERGLRAHQSQPFVTLACRPLRSTSEVPPSPTATLPAWQTQEETPWTS